MTHKSNTEFKISLDADIFPLKRRVCELRSGAQNGVNQSGSPVTFETKT